MLTWRLVRLYPALYKFEDTFSRFDTIYQRVTDRRTDGQMDRQTSCDYKNKHDVATVAMTLRPLLINDRVKMWTRTYTRKTSCGDPAPNVEFPGWYSLKRAGVPAYLKEHLVQRVPSRQTRSAESPLLYVPKLTTDFARRSFSYAAPVIWNSLPTEVMLCTSEHSFKRHLKTLLFNCCNQTVWPIPHQRLCSLL